MIIYFTFDPYFSSYYKSLPEDRIFIDCDINDNVENLKILLTIRYE